MAQKKSAIKVTVRKLSDKTGLPGYLTVHFILLYQYQTCVFDLISRNMADEPPTKKIKTEKEENPEVNIIPHT